MALDARAKRVYDPPEEGDGYRVLVDHVWPRGVSHASAPSWTSGPRSWRPATSCASGSTTTRRALLSFAPATVASSPPIQSALVSCVTAPQAGAVTVLYAAHDEEHNNAVVLTEFLCDGRAARRTRLPASAGRRQTGSSR